MNVTYTQGLRLPVPNCWHLLYKLYTYTARTLQHAQLNFVGRHLS